MKRNVLIMVTSDPRTSARPAEAIRIAAGIAAWEKLSVTLYLRDAAILALGEFTDELMDDENIAHFLPAIQESGRVLAQENSRWLLKIAALPATCEAVSDAQLAELCARQHSVLRF